MSGHLRFQDRLHLALHPPTKELRIIQQRRLRRGRQPLPSPSAIVCLLDRGSYPAAIVEASGRLTQGPGTPNFQNSMGVIGEPAQLQAHIEDSFMYTRAGLFAQFADRIKALPPCDQYRKSDLLVDQFRLYASGPLAIYYAPIDSVTTGAKVVLLGITPGWTQMELAYQEARVALLEGARMDEVCRRAKSRASFAGQMRSHLIQMLDDIGLHHSLARETSAELFRSHSDLLHATSALRYPVFVNGKNYSGHAPNLLRVAIFRDIIHTDLTAELAQVPEALVIPLRCTVNAVVEAVVDNDMLDRRRCLLDFRIPHDSTGTGWRNSPSNEPH